MSEARARDAFLERARAFVDQRVDRALDDLLVGDRRAARMPAAVASDRISAVDLGIGVGVRGSS